MKQILCQNVFSFCFSFSSFFKSFLIIFPHWMHFSSVDRQCSNIEYVQSSCSPRQKSKCRTKIIIKINFLTICPLFKAKRATSLLEIAIDVWAYAVKAATCCTVCDCCNRDRYSRAIHLNWAQHMAVNLLHWQCTCSNKVLFYIISIRLLFFLLFFYEYVHIRVEKKTANDPENTHIDLGNFGIW